MSVWGKKIVIFFSVDIIERQDGIERIIEIKDGQVSDLVGWSIAAFVKIWKQESKSV